MISRTYHAGNSTITLRFDDITTSKAQVLVSSDDFWLSMGGGVSRAILLAGGDQIATEAGKMAPALLGDVVVTAAGRLPARYIFHAITLAGGRCDLPGDTIVRQTTWKAMQLLPLLGCHSIAFPAIGAGVAGIPYQTVASEMATVLARCLLDTAESYCVELYLLDRSERMSPGDFFMFFEAFAQRTLGVATAQHGTQAVLEPPGAVLGSADAGVVREAERRQQAFNMLRHLDARRNELEALLLRSLSSDEPSPPEMLARIKAQLAQIQDLRQGYQAELAPAS
ncbi:MAG TPA: macro domain-containing protein, partial [Anaerolineae bacterium]|nr:macro domain-containing protein [Anaerolineae bacterium]